MQNNHIPYYSQQSDILIPNVIEQRGHAEYSYDIYSRLLNDRIVFLNSEVNHATSSVIIAQMLFLEAVNPEEDIYFYINSHGGSVSDGFAIYDTMNFIKCDVATICFGMAASMGAFLLAAGQKGKRYALPYSQIMIHQPLAKFKGSASDIKIRADKILNTREKINTILSECTGKSYDEIVSSTERDNYMTSEEALAFGLIDSIYTKRK